VLDKGTCVFCENGPNSQNNLQEFRTLGADANVRLMVADLNDTAIEARIAAGDLIAIEAKYHLKCLVNLRNRHRALLRHKYSHSNY